MLVTMMLVLLLTIKKMDCGIQRNNFMERITQENEQKIQKLKILMNRRKQRNLKNVMVRDQSTIAEWLTIIATCTITLV